MTLRDLPDVIKQAPRLKTDDTAAKAVRLMRARGLPAVPVADGSQLLGFACEDDLAALAAQAADPGAAAAGARVEQLMRPMDLIVRDDQDAAGVLTLMQERRTGAAAVIAGDGQFLGLVLRNDLIAALVGEHATPPIAGLATPFGVYLTTGAQRAGAGDLALASTGVALMAMNLLSGGIIFGLARLAERRFPAVISTTVPLAQVRVVDVLVAYALQVTAFLLLLRFSPLTRTHAAEHMVVRAIEEGEDLTVQKVRAMSRVHPRCGTNLMALLILLFISEQFLSSMDAVMDDATRILTLFVLVVVILLSWRRLGAGIQRWVTTRRPSDAQLQRAIRVGESLLAKNKAHPGARAVVWRRIWNMGFVQVVSGFAALAAAVEYGWPLVQSAWSHLIH